VTSLLKLGCGGCVHLYIADGVEPNCWINSGRGIPKPCLDRLNFDEARSLKVELRALGAKFRLDVGIMLENQRKLTEERNALKEQVEAYKRGAKLQVGIDWHEAFVDVESRLAKAEKILIDLAKDEWYETGEPKTWRSVRNAILSEFKEALRGVGEDKHE
jgi:hypothetical protein